MYARTLKDRFETTLRKGEWVRAGIQATQAASKQVLGMRGPAFVDHSSFALTTDGILLEMELCKPYLSKPYSCAAPIRLFSGLVSAGTCTWLITSGSFMIFLSH